LGHDDYLRQFDPSFFGINPLEASSMDPQQRKLLEVVYESFENAGATLEELSGSRTSCFVGCFTNDMRRITSRDLEYGAPYEMTGSDMTILSNRINYVFNLKGPSMTIDTACSSSLYALHLACQSLISGDSDAAIVGGSNIINDIQQHIFSVRLGVMSPTSTCHTFDERADGFGRGDGICAVYLKKLSAAIANKDPIRAVIRATAVNSNGRSQGINHPSSKGQEAVIREAYTRANLNYEDTGYFECHGTGTPVGDPIEVLSAGNVFAPGRTRHTPLLLSSIKTNIGHTEGASGLASVIKAVLSIENKLIPATVGVEKLNPAIDFKEGRLEVVRTTMPWPEALLKRVSINSFGYGGANAHCIIESPDILLGPKQPISRPLLNSEHAIATARHMVDISVFQIQQIPPKHLLVFSSHDQHTLETNINALAAVAEKYAAADIAYTLTKKTKHRCRAFATTTESDRKSHLVPEQVQHGTELVSQPLVIAFVFTGQGAQWPGMGYGLIQQYEIVRKTMATLQSALDALPTPPEWRLVEELSKSAETSRMHETALAQPLSTALQIALTVLLQSWGIQPKAVVGHSSGEVAAAFAAGLLTISEAIAIAYYRGIAVTKYGKPGAMMAVGLGPEEVQAFMVDQADIVIACQNSPKSVTLSGGANAITEVHSRLAEARVFSRILNTSQNAYHSHLVKDAGQYYEDSFQASLPASSPAAATFSIPMYSCINGRVLDSPDDVRIAYWRENLENPVNFTQALSSLIEAQPTVNCLIEVGMHSALAGPIKQIRASLGINPEKLCYIPSIIRGEDNVENVLKLAGSLWTAGYPIDLKIINGPGHFLPNLPTYQWNYEGKVLWTENRLSRQLRFRKHARHDLLGSLVVSSSSFNPTWRNRLRIKDVPWLADHRIGNDVIFPAAGYCAVAIEAATQFAESAEIVAAGFTIQHLNIEIPLVITPEGEVETLFDLHVVYGCTHASRKIFEFSLSSVNAEDKWIEHASGKIVLHQQGETPSMRDGYGKEIALTEDMGRSDEKWYTALAKIGLHYGPTFRPLRNIQSDTKKTAAAQIDLQPSKEVMIDESRYAIHPATLDGCIQLAVIAACDGNVKGISKAYLPTTIDNLTVWRSSDLQSLPARGLLSSYGACHGMRSVRGSSEVVTVEGYPLAQMTVSLRSLEGGFASQHTEPAREPFTRLVWQPIASLIEEHFPGLEASVTEHRQTRTEKLWLVYKNSPHPLAQAIEGYAKDMNIDIGIVDLSDVQTHICKGSRIMMLAELEGSIFMNMTNEEMDAVRSLFSMASSVLWVTAGGLLRGKKPEYSMLPGMIKSITKAQPSLRLSSIDVDPDDVDYVRTARLIVQHEMRLFNDDDGAFDNQLVISDGVVYASRFVLDENANHDFVRQLDPVPQKCQIRGDLALAFQQVGRLDSFYFEPSSMPSVPQSDEVRLRPTAYALGQREAAILKGTQPAAHFSNVCVALVEQSGSDSGRFKRGDRVVCCAPGKFDTSLVASDSTCELLLPEEDAGDIVTSLLSYCTALRALESVAEGQVILVQGLPALSTVAVARLSQAYGREIILVHESDEIVRLFAEQYPDIGAHTQYITGEVMVENILGLTGHQGINVALISPKSPNCSEIWQCLARNGRLTYIMEDSECPNLGLLDPSVFARGASVTSFNVYDMLATQPEDMYKLVRSALDMLRNGRLPNFTPSATYDVSELPAAINTISQSKTTTNVVLKYDRESMVPVHLPYEQVRFSSESSYLLVGCLGGLGRSLVKWMFSRGARHFVFLSRSGADKSEAAKFISEVKELGGKSIVVRGDVSIRSDVDEAIKQAKTPIKGVMQLAMALTVSKLSDAYHSDH